MVLEGVGLAHFCPILCWQLGRYPSQLLSSSKKHLVIAYDDVSQWLRLLGVILMSAFNDTNFDLSH